MLAACSTTSTSTSTSTSTGQLPAATVARLQRALDQTRAQGQVPGVIAGVWTPRGDWTGTSGTKGPGQTGSPTVSDHTRIGSLTKTMTATVLLQLVAEGKVSLDDPISKYVPGLPNGSATLRQLADMTSGIPSYTANSAFQQQLFADPQQAMTPAQLVASVRGEAPDFAPGQGWEYSNTNYVLLGMVIEQVTGKPISEVFQQRLFGPLGMHQTSFPSGAGHLPSPYLSGTTNQGQPPGQTTDSTSWSPTEAFTAGEVISTFGDLQKWAAALFTGKGILTPAMQQLRRNSIIRNIPPNNATAGYGIGIGDRNGWWGHDGDIPGYTTVVFHNYQLDTTVIVVANSDVSLPGPTPAGTAPATAVSSALMTALQ